jgi:hypothetical protein
MGLAHIMHGQMINEKNCLVGKPEEKNHLRDIDVDGGRY